MSKVYRANQLCMSKLNVTVHLKGTSLKLRGVISSVLVGEDEITIKRGKREHYVQLEDVLYFEHRSKY